MKKFGHFDNDRGYRLDKIRDDPYLWIFTKAMYEFTLDPDKPLTYVTPNGTRLQPDRHLAETDMGSIPLTLQIFIPKDRFLKSFMFHDSGYNHGGLYMAPVGSNQFVFAPMSRSEVDNLLWFMVGAENGNIAQRAVIYRGVRLGGWASWDHDKTALCRKQDFISSILS